MSAVLAAVSAASSSVFVAVLAAEEFELYSAAEVAVSAVQYHSEPDQMVPELTSVPLLQEHF